MFLKYLKWKRSFVPNGYISPSEIAEDIAQDKVFTQGLDKKGRPIVVAFAAKHFQSKNGADGFKRMFLPWDPFTIQFLQPFISCPLIIVGLVQNNDNYFFSVCRVRSLCSWEALFKVNPFSLLIIIPVNFSHWHYGLINWIINSVNYSSIWSVTLEIILT